MRMLYDPGFDSVREGQQVFRCLLAAMSWPGETQSLPPARLRPSAPWPSSLLQVARTLLDERVTFAAHGRGAEILAHYLNVNTGARSVPMQDANYVFAGHPLDELDIWPLSAGTMLAPEEGATLVLLSRHLAGLSENPNLQPDRDGSPAPDGGVTIMALQGRGIRGERTLLVDDPVGRVLERLAARKDEYPLGIDVVLVDGYGNVAALPRKTRWKKESMAWAM